MLLHGAQTRTASARGKQGADANPLQSAIWKQGGGRSHRFARGEVAIMRRNDELSPADPKLEQSRIDVDQGRASKAGQQSGVDRVVEVQQEVRLRKRCFGLSLGHVDMCGGLKGDDSTPLAHVENEFAAEPESVHPCSERCQRSGVPLFIVAAAEVFHPVHVATQLAQALGILHIDGEVSAAFGEVRNTVRRNDDGGHVGCLLRRRVHCERAETTIVDELNRLLHQHATDERIAQGP